MNKSLGWAMKLFFHWKHNVQMNRIRFLGFLWLEDWASRRGYSNYCLCGRVKIKGPTINMVNTCPMCLMGFFKAPVATNVVQCCDWNKPIQLSSSHCRWPGKSKLNASDLGGEISKFVDPSTPTVISPIFNLNLTLSLSFLGLQLINKMG